MLWQLFQQDALIWLADQSAEQYDALITDPPYSSGGLHAKDRAGDSANAKYVNNPGKYPEFSGENRDQHSYMLWSTMWLTEAHRVLKPGSPFLVFTDWRQLSVMINAVQAAGFTYRGCVPWTRRKHAGRRRGGSANRRNSFCGAQKARGMTRTVRLIRV
ncbi:DNA methyltransferase [uncultured Roseibium sp.]|uniref:DNA methyltransferase n=1 Tax=uncultured Roseibium sp. TaxID=1936171 RepID=UPI0032170978